MASVTRRQQTTRAQRRAAIEQAMLAATERLMESGTSFTELSVDRLAGEAGISRPTFYVYFEDKGDVLRRLAERVFVEFTDAARIWWDRADRHDPADLRAAMTAVVATHRRHRALIAAVVEMAAYDPAVGARYREVFDANITALEKIIARGIDAGALRPIPAHDTAAALTWMTERYVYQAVPDIDDDQRIAEALTQIIWATLYLRPADGRSVHRGCTS